MRRSAIVALLLLGPTSALAADPAAGQPGRGEPDLAQVDGAVHPDDPAAAAFLLEPGQQLPEHVGHGHPGQRAPDLPAHGR